MLSEKENLEELYLERKLIDQILNNGITIDIVSKSFRRFFLKRSDRFGRKVRSIKIVSPYLSTMDRAADVKLKMAINMEEFKLDPVGIKNKIIKDNAFLMAKCIAIYYLNDRFKIKLFANILAFYFANRIDNQLMKDVLSGLEVLEDAKNFINSTVSMAGSRRTTQPKAEEIETNPAKAAVRQSEIIPPMELGA